MQTYNTDLHPIVIVKLSNADRLLNLNSCNQKKKKLAQICHTGQLYKIK